MSSFRLFKFQWIVPIIAVILSTAHAYGTPLEIEEKIKETLRIRQEFLHQTQNIQSIKTKTLKPVVTGYHNVSEDPDSSAENVRSHVDGYLSTPTSTEFYIQVATQEQIDLAVARWERAKSQALDRYTIVDWSETNEFIKGKFMSPAEFEVFSQRVERLTTLLNELELLVPFERNLPVLLTNEYEGIKYWALNSEFKVAKVVKDILPAPRTINLEGKAIYKMKGWGIFKRSYLAGREKLEAVHFKFQPRKAYCDLNLTKIWR